MDNHKNEEGSKELYRNEYLLKDSQCLIVRVPDEFNFTLEQEREFIRSNTNNKMSRFLIAEIGGRIVANCSVGIVQNQKRYLHRAAIGIAVCKEYWNMGIGKKMMQECIRWCKEQAVE